MKIAHRISSIVLAMSLGTLVFAQSEKPKSEAQRCFEKLKSLAGSWEGRLGGTGTELDGKTMHVSLRVTSTGNAIMHEMTGAEKPDEDENHPLTIIYLEGDRLLLTHYCDVGNRPRMVAKTAPDGKTVEFDFLDIANYSSAQGSHMGHAVFTMLDANHHTEEWTAERGEALDRWAFGSPPHEMKRLAR